MGTLKGTTMARIAMAVLMLTVALGAHAARVTDTFDTPPGEPGRAPFTWWSGGARQGNFQQYYY